MASELIGNSARTVRLENSVWIDGLLFSFLLAGEDTQGRFSLTRAIQRQGCEPPYHIHKNADETFYVVEGTLTFYLAGESLAAPAGTTVFVGRGREHSFTVETPTAETLILFTPAGTENFFKEISVPARTLTLPPIPEGPSDVARLMTAAAKYDIEITGPPPEARSRKSQ
jgi:quercetin dioxygenase-like cupin family protein